MARVRWVGALGVCAASLAACSFFVPFSEYDRDFGVASPDGGAPGDACAGAACSDAATACDDTTTTRNCGACGHDCLGAACTFGTCASEAVVSFSGTNVAAVALDSTNVYVVGKLFGISAVGRLAKTTPNADPVLLATTTGDPVFVAVRGGAVYFTRKGAAPGVASAAVDADGGAAATLVGGQVAPSSIAVDDTEVFWTNAPAGGDVWHVSRAGASDAGVFAPPQNAVAVALDGGFVYWTVGGSDGKVMRAARDGSGAAPIVASAPWAAGLVLDADSIYWTEAPPGGGGGTIERAPKAGGAATTLADGQKAPVRVAEYDAFVYWVADDGVWRVAKAGGAPLILARAADDLDLAVDATHVYWVSDKLFSQEHEVRRVPR